jgi:hypothetical protein
MATPFVLGLANGLAQGFALGLIMAAFPGVGTGSGVARVTGPQPTPLMIQGFTEAGLKGEALSKLAQAIGLGLTQTFAAFSMPVVITGPAGSGPGAGTTSGKIV